MMSPDGMMNNADLVIEILNENPVGQINSIKNFKSRSPYWGSKYGVADRGVRGYRILVEAIINVGGVQNILLILNITLAQELQTLEIYLNVVLGDAILMFGGLFTARV